MAAADPGTVARNRMYSTTEVDPLISASFTRAPGPPARGGAGSTAADLSRQQVGPPRVLFRGPRRGGGRRGAPGDSGVLSRRQPSRGLTTGPRELAAPLDPHQLVRPGGRDFYDHEAQQAGVYSKTLCLSRSRTTRCSSARPFFGRVRYDARKIRGRQSRAPGPDPAGPENGGPGRPRGSPPSRQAPLLV